MKLGIVDLDTSHPENWIPIERELGHEVVAVFDDGSVHPEGYAQRFAQQHAIPRVVSSLTEMARVVDCAVIHSCNWDTHVEKARPFVQHGKAVMIDKPLAGNLEDLRQLRSWAQEGARITGGSSLRFCAETCAWRKQPEAERGVPHTVVCGCGVDEFNYGIHAYSLLSGILGGGITRVRHLEATAQRRIQVTWRDGRVGIVVIGKSEAWLPFYATIVTERAVTQYTVDSGKLYRALLTRALPYLARQVEQPPVLMENLIEPELAALAARRSWLEGNREVELAELSGEDSYDGLAFASEYRKTRYPQVQLRQKRGVS